MIDERHILINGKCMISVYCEDYGSSTSGGVAFLLIIPPPHHKQITHWHLGLIFNQGLSGTWHYFWEYVILPYALNRRQENKFLPPLALIEIFHHAQVFWMPVRQCFSKLVCLWMQLHFWVQTLIETLCNLVLDFADNRAFWCIFLSCLISNFSLNLHLVSFMFTKSGNHMDSVLWKGKM